MNGIQRLVRRSAPVPLHRDPEYWRDGRYAQQQAEIDENMALATRDLLACIEALRVEQGPFLRALDALAVMIAMVGLASPVHLLAYRHIERVMDALHVPSQVHRSSK